MSTGGTKIKSSLAPWLSVRTGVLAIEFYKSAFGAVEVYRVGESAGMSLDGAGPHRPNVGACRNVQLWVSTTHEGR